LSPETPYQQRLSHGKVWEEKSDRIGG
jgi:hypothetical protein